MLEKAVENYLIAQVEAAGGISAKMTVTGRRGWPDRLVILPGGKIALVELKRPKGGVWSATQKQLFIRLGELGVTLYRLNSTEAVDWFLRAMSDETTTKEGRAE